MSNPTIRNESGVTPLNDEYTLEEVDSDIEEVKYKHTELLSDASGRASRDLREANAMKRHKIDEQAGPPAWFTSFETRFNQRLADFKTEINEKIRELKNELRYQDAKNFNRLKRNRGDIISPIPFLDGSLPPPALVAIKSIDDINAISKTDLMAYLSGYGIQFNREESPASLRAKLRDAVGLGSEYDLRFELRDSWR